MIQSNGNWVRVKLSVKQRDHSSQTMTAQIFISYSKKDSNFAHRLADDLIEAGFKIWIDRSLQVGEDWEDTIENQIRAANEVIVILSPNAVASKWVQHEGSIAYGLDKTMFPVLMKGIETEDHPLWAKKYQYHSFVEKEYQSAFDDLIAALTPPNPIQDLLSQQLQTHQQTGELIGEAILRVIEENHDSLEIDNKAEDLISKSQLALANRQRERKELIEATEIARQKELEKAQELVRTQRQRTIVLTIGLLIAIGLSVISYLLFNQSNRNLLDAQWANTQSALHLDDANIANTQSAANEATAQIASTLAVAQEGTAVAERHLAGIAKAQEKEQREVAEIVADIALSRQLAAQSIIEADNDIELSLLLSLEANRIEETIEARGSLLRNLVENFYPSKKFPPLQKGNISGVAISPDGTLAATASNDTSIVIWNLSSLEPVHILAGHTNGVICVAFSPDGLFLASGGDDQKVMVWNVATGEQMGEPMIGHTDDVWSITYDPSGQMLISGGLDGQIIVWDLNTFQPHMTLNNQGSQVYSISISPNGDLLAVGGETTNITFWNLENGEPVDIQLEGHTDKVRSVAFHPTDQILASGSDDNSIILWDLATGQPVGPPLKAHSDQILSFSFNSDGSLLASGGFDQKIVLWDTKTLQPVGKHLTGHSNNIRSVAFNPKNSSLISTGYDEQIIMWDLISQNTIIRRLFSPTKQEDINSSLIAADLQGSTIAWVIDDQVFLVNSSTCEIVRTFPQEHSGWIMSVAFSPDGKTLATGGADRKIVLWNVATGQKKGELLGHHDWVMSLEFHPENNLLASGGRDHQVFLWDLETKLAESLQKGKKGTAHSGPVWELTFHPNGEILATGSADKTVILWTIGNLRPLDQFPVQDQVFSLSFNHSGEILFVGQYDANIIRLDVIERVQLGTALVGHDDPVWSIVHSSNEQLLASGSLDNKIIIWDGKTMEMIGTPLDVLSVLFLGDTLTLVSSSLDGTLSFIDLNSESWKQIACNIVGRNFSELEWNRYLPEYEYTPTCPQWPAGD